MGDAPKPDYARNMRLVGHSGQGGRSDGLQVMVHRGFAYVAHPWSGGFTIIDVRDPRKPGATNFVPAPNNTWTIHLQTHDDLLLVVHALDLFADDRVGITNGFLEDFDLCQKPLKNSFLD